MMNELTNRQKLILTLVIHEYARNAVPVGSRNLVESYNLEMSSATVRNELAALTEMNYLRQPHTSAGRVPTEEGYRYFVGRLLRHTDLPDTTRHTITHQFYQMRDDVEQWARLAASVLAKQSRAASIVTAPHPEEARLKHLELISTRGRQVLMILVMAGGEIRQHLLMLDESVSQEQLSIASDAITNQFQGRDILSIQKQAAHLDRLEQDVVEKMLEEMQRSNEVVSGQLFTDGITNVLSEPEFSGSGEARQALRVFEEPALLQDLLDRSAVLTTNVGGVQVLIGSDGAGDDLRQCSVVLARYGLPGLATGTLGVLGPMRMSYGRSISTVRFLSTLLSNLVAETLVD